MKDDVKYEMCYVICHRTIFVFHVVILSLLLLFVRCQPKLSFALQPFQRKSGLCTKEKMAQLLFCCLFVIIVNTRRSLFIFFFVSRCFIQSVSPTCGVVTKKKNYLNKSRVSVCLPFPPTVVDS